MWRPRDSNGTRASCCSGYGPTIWVIAPAIWPGARRMDCGRWVLGGFAASRYALGYRVLAAPTTPLHAVPSQTPVIGTSWR